MKILVTGSAGFIGSAVSIRLLERGDDVVGVDNHNDYYDPSLKEARLSRHKDHPNYTHIRMDLEDRSGIASLFKEYKFEAVVNLAAQAGVRYSIENPLAYIGTNLVGFAHILEGCRHNKVGHLVYASSSSTYGLNTKQPFSTHQGTNHPVSLYAATKKSNELMAYTYGHLYGFKTTGLRFFTVYGPWGRPDMAYHLFTDAILNNKPIKVFNNGKMMRDFTYIDDIVNGVTKVLEKNIDSRVHYKIYNIGNNKTESLQDFIITIEKAIGKKAIKEMYPMQQGDVPTTFADVDELIKDYNYSPSTDISTGIDSFVRWFSSYYKF